MSVKFTCDQQKAINLRNKNILVSAAAGSGKTAVLVERIIDIISNPEKPVDVDRLLVVTFTNAAAEEMKERILAAIEKKCLENPENEHLIRQKTYIHSAQITTIHSFCMDLIKENFNELDIDPGFRLGDEAELKLIKTDVMNELLNDYYEEASEEFLDFIEAYSGNKSDGNIDELILKIYDFSRSHPWPEEWLESCVDNYLVNQNDFEKTEWMKQLHIFIKEMLNSYFEEIIKALKITEELDGPYMYGDIIEGEKEQLEKLINIKSYTDIYEIISGFEFKRLPNKKDDSVNPDKRKEVKNKRDTIKDGIKSIAKNYFSQSLDSYLKDINDSYKQVEVIIKLAKEFSERYKNKKKTNNILDFNDLEHFALKLLIKRENQGIVYTNVANELSEYYEEVIIDEYQDSNNLQEVILKSVSGERVNNPNLICVGDVKQSIYKFRMARPELFMDKYEIYPEEDVDKNQKIILGKNFRSRKEIIESVNIIFEKIMTKNIGGIKYDSGNALYYGADYPEIKDGQENKTEILLVEDIDKNGKELEAIVVAKRIKELINTGFEVNDKESGEMRQIKYSDIVILLRGVKGWSEIYEEAFNEEAIPCYSETREGYFDALEIRTTLNFLNIIDNPRQDIPFVSVLKSNIVNISSNELATIKAETFGEDFYENVCEYIESGKNHELKCKLKSFIEKLKEYRRKSEYLSVYEMLSYILDDTNYYSYIIAMPGGIKRKANIDLLLDKAVSYEKTSYKGLFNFIRYVEKLKKLEVDFSEASVSGEKDNVVRIMTIHKSKGLEFPVVFVSGLGKLFNNQDMIGTVLHSELGLGVDYIDSENRIKAQTLLKQALALKVKQENLGEELRVLYVALTRAKEKLILTGNVKSLEKNLEKWDQEINYSVLYKANNFLDWIIPVTLNNECFDFKVICEEDIVSSKVKDFFVRDSIKTKLLKWDAGVINNEAISNQIKERLLFKYEYDFDVKLNTKMSVSEIKQLNMKKEFINNEEKEETLPEFIKENKTETGSDRGSAYHKLFEKIIFKDGYNNVDIQKYIDEIGITENINPNDFILFFESEIGKRMIKAENDNRLFKEKQYVMGVEAKTINPEYVGEEMILIQGIVDAYFEEDDEIVIVDYKTDRVNREEDLIERYSIQLKYYQKALEKITGKTVKEKVIYSTSLGREVYII